MPNFVSSYITQDGKYITVQVYDITLLSRGVYMHPDFKRLYIKDGFFYLVYSLHQWEKDIDLFIKGKYSKLSHKAIKFIRTYSGLNYKTKVNGKLNTDARLLALNRDPVLVEFWERELDLREPLGNDDELLDKPPKKSFISIEDLKCYKQKEQL